MICLEQYNHVLYIIITFTALNILNFIMIEILIKSSYLFNNAYLKIYKSLKLSLVSTLIG